MDRPDRELQKDEALGKVIESQLQLDAMEERVLMLRDQFREERDFYVRDAIRVGVKKADIAIAIHVTPQWLNKLLRGEAYRRKSD